MRHTPHLLLTVLLASTIHGFAEDRSFDVVVYGGSCSGVIAAVQAAKMGKRVALVSPDRHLGGLTTSGLGWVDVGNPATIGGLGREYFHRVWNHYQQPGSWTWEKPKKLGGQHAKLPEGDETMWILEPSVGERLFDQMVGEAKIALYRDEWLDRGKGGVTIADQRITAMRTLAGHAYKAGIFIDATYEGDLMAAAGVSYLAGREANAQYHETLNGIRYDTGFEGLLKSEIDPYVVKGDPASGLLPRINPMPGAAGEAHHSTQTFNYRMCLTDVPENRVMIGKPDGYDEKQFEIIFRAIEAGLPKDRLFKLSRMPNRKTDSNNHSPFSTDLIGMSWDYPEADYATRLRVAKAHEQWQRGLVWTLQNHPRVPEAVRKFYAGWGLPKDEFADNGNWPYALYVREARRMIGDYVVTENTARSKEVVDDPVAYGSYHMDSHYVQYVLNQDRKLATEGGFFVGVPKPFGISYRVMTPKRAECTNLLVTICISSSHAAYGSVRMEPVFMVMAQAAATAAVMAIDGKTSVQDVPYPALRDRLITDGLIITKKP